MERKIVKCRFVHAHWEESKIYVEYDDGSEGLLMTYYPDELSFVESELIGLTEKQAFNLKREKDIAYLRS